MQKTKSKVALIVAVVMMALSTILSACGDGNAKAKLLKSDEKLIVIEAIATGGSIEDALKELKSDGEIDYEGSTSEFGFYLNSINGYVPDVSKNEFWAIYTTLGEYEGVSYSNVEFGVYEYDGKECASASYGISGMPLVEGEIYIIAISTY